MKELPLNGFYSEESRKLSDRRCINFIPTVSDAGALSSLSLMPTTGLENYGDITVNSSLLGSSAQAITSQVFNFKTIQGGLSAVFVVVDRVFFVDGFGGLTIKDYPNPAGYPLPIRASYTRMATDGFRCLICAPSSGTGNSRDRAVYFENDLSAAGVGIDTATIFNQADAELTDVAYLGGRFLYLSSQVTIAGFNRVFYSDIGTVEPVALNFFAPNNLNSQLVGMEVLNDRLYLFSSEKGYIYSVTSSVDTPFIKNGELEYGLLNSFSKCVYLDSLAGVFKEKGGALFVGLITGAGIKKISTRAIDQRIFNAFQDDTNFGPERRTRLFTFMDNGRSFLCLTSPEFTFVYEAASGLWHERKTLRDGDLYSLLGGRNNWQYIGALEYDADFLKSSYFIGDTIETVDLPTNQFRVPISKVNTNIGTEDGELIERTLISSPFNENNNRMVLDEVQPQCEVDFTTPIDGWSDPKINLSVSNDFGNSFDGERSLGIGPSGNYSNETRFLGIGYFMQAFTLKLRTINPYPTRIIKLLARVTGGSF